MCVYSLLYETLQFWHEDERVEMVQADSRPFIALANAIEARFYEDDLVHFYFIGSNRNSQPTRVSA